MKAEEIMVGNLIKYNDSSIFKVVGVHEFGLDVEDDIEATYMEFENFEPILLTEEWLLKFGFEKDGTEWKLFPCFEIQIIVMNEGNYNGIMFYTRTIHTDYAPIYCGLHINAVHQLQNLYFSLTGTSLTIKES